MSLTSPVPDTQGIAHTATGQPCFLCGEALHDPAVFWAGMTAEIYLHPACVVELAVALFRDLSELKTQRKHDRRASDAA